VDPHDAAVARGERRLATARRANEARRPGAERALATAASAVMIAPVGALDLALGVATSRAPDAVVRRRLRRGPAT